MEKARYERNINLIGADGQAKLLAAKVLVVGAGGLGAPTLLYLAAAGVGTIGVCDFDVVAPSNLNRQILYTPENIDQSKAKIAAANLKKQNPDISIITHEVRLDLANVREIIRDYQVVLACVDNLPTRFLLNDACVALGIPLVHGGVSKYYGEQMTVVPGSPCLRCALPDLPEAEAKENPANGVMGAVAGFVGSLQGLEGIKLILGLPVNTGYICYYDLLYNEFDKIPIKAKPECVCSIK